MALTPKERSDFVRELSESIDNTNPKQVVFKRQFINALMKKETVHVDGFSAEETFYFQKLIDVAAKREKDEIEEYLVTVKEFLKDENNNATNNNPTNSQSAAKKIKKEENEKEDFLQSIKNIQLDSGMEKKEKLKKIKSIVDTKEKIVFNLLSRSEIKKMLEASETAIVEGSVHPWEIKPVLDRIEMLGNLLATKTGSDSIGSAFTRIDANATTIKQRLEQLDDTVLAKALEKTFDFVSGLQYTCLRKGCFHVFDSIDKAKKHVVSKEIAFYNSNCN